MHLIQLLLPLYDNEGQRLPSELFVTVRKELTEQFRGLTVYSRSPAEGLWQDGERQTTRDEVVLFEIMVDRLDQGWWSAYRKELEERFAQDEIVIRAQPTQKL